MERGAGCAYIMFIYPFVAASALLHPSISTIGQYFMGSLTGLINPVFLLAAITQRRILKILLVSMIPFSWLLLYSEKLYPREGYFLWITGMLLVLVSDPRRVRENSPKLR
jgi:hypothetical protein